jgi:hypothetical protein
MSGSAAYRWDGERGSLEWDNPQLGATMAREGWSAASAFDVRFRPPPLVREGKLVAKAGEAGTIITVGGTARGPKELRFDKDGRLAGMVVAMVTGGAVTEVVLTFAYEQVGEKFAISGWTVEFEIPGIGKAKETTRFTLKEVDGRRVPERAEAKTEGARGPLGSRTIEFADWKFNDDAE